MFVLGNILLVIAQVFSLVVGFYEWVIIASIIISWIRPNPSNDIVRTLLTTVHRLTEPVYFQIRKRLPQSLLSTGLDFTPMILLIALYAINMLVSGTLVDAAYRFKMNDAANNPMQGFPSF